jgi:hypothetical protein
VVVGLAARINPLLVVVAAAFSSSTSATWMSSLSADLAARFARIALGHVSREYPNKLDHVIESRLDLCSPSALHPIFFGSFDWHSCVHGYWTLAVVLRRFPDLPGAAEIRALFDDSFIAEKVEGEVAYLRRSASRGFERPYGWAWLLKLQSELVRHHAGWAATLQPLANVFVRRLYEWLPLADYPIRTGMHTCTAFAFALAADYARAVGDDRLLCALTDKVRAWYLNDRDAQAWEPSGDDFLSPTLMEAECLRRLLPPAEFQPWFAAFLPRLDEGEPRALFEPVRVSDRSDGKIAHLDGLNLSRAWCWRELGQDEAAQAHLAASLPHVVGDYMGEHWLASFALLALTAGGR